MSDMQTNFTPNSTPNSTSNENVLVNSTENTSIKSAEEEILEAEKIVDHTHEKATGKTLQPCTQNSKLCYEKFVVGLMGTQDPGCYCVKWLNFPSTENTWESANEKIEEVTDLVDDYWRDFCTRNEINRERLTFDLIVEESSRMNSELTKENTDLRSENAKIKSMFKRAETELVIAKNSSQVENLKFQLEMEKAKSQASIAEILKLAERFNDMVDLTN
jgi:hypothetical protein